MEKLKAAKQKGWYLESKGEGHSTPKNPLTLLYCIDSLFLDTYLQDE